MLCTESTNTDDIDNVDASKAMERFTEILNPVNEAILRMQKDIEALKQRTCTHYPSRQTKVLFS